FAELVDRLGPLVYGACRRLLSNPADVEDAFQATFLVLVRRADTLAGRSVGPWLHRVAVWTARSFRRRIARSLAGPLDDSPGPGTPPGLDATDARLDIDAAVSALPEKYRVPAMVLAVAGAAAVPPGLCASAVRAAGLYRTSSLAAAASPAVAELTEGVLRMFPMKKLAAGLAAAVAVAGLGFGLAAGTGPRAEAQAPKPSQPAAPADDLKARREKLDHDLESAR